MLFVRHSKTDIFGRGECIPPQKVEGSACPVTAVGDYLSVRKTGSVFLAHKDGSALTRFQFSALFNRCLALIGEQPKEYGTQIRKFRGSVVGIRHVMWITSGQNYLPRVSVFRSRGPSGMVCRACLHILGSAESRLNGTWVNGTWAFAIPHLH